jgi:hypothetical protein
MKAVFFAIFMLFAASPLAFALDTLEGCESYHVVLYQPEEVVQARVGTVADLTNYIEQLRAVCSEFFATTRTPETLNIVVAVRPGKRARIWLMSSTQSVPDAQREPLRKDLEAIPPCEVHNGPLVFAISAKLTGGAGQSPRRDEVPIPKEWQEAITATGRQKASVPDGVLDLIWPDKQ